MWLCRSVRGTWIFTSDSIDVARLTDGREIVIVPVTGSRPVGQRKILYDLGRHRVGDGWCHLVPVL